MASNDQKARFNNLLCSYPTIEWTDKEKIYLLWLCQLDINTFESFEIKSSKAAVEKERIYERSTLFIFLLHYNGLNSNY
ncbi:hypothetical protein [Enterococcus casseliflavus]|uniref:hypothetical protein n=1 Tax=Enterococcus casseliflavus TaxID=37734 RepID=UPI0039A5F4AF